ncbi:MAG: GNAT family N-acetyltransferase [Candidatus Hodarchaeales archaeon]|jgi:RimJ/RimL family protein N-acetyltransferase
MPRSVKNSVVKGRLHLRDVEEGDLTVFFENQLDPEANYMAAFTAKDPRDRKAFTNHWAKLMADKTVTIRTIIFDGDVAGSISKFEQCGNSEVTYWLGKKYWGKGIATQALSRFLVEVEHRPLYARAAKDNIGSIRVLEKCGFSISGEDKGFANARGEEVEEHIFVLQ